LPNEILTAGAMKVCSAAAFVFVLQAPSSFNTRKAAGVVIVEKMGEHAGNPAMTEVVHDFVNQEDYHESNSRQLWIADCLGANVGTVVC
jgi:hypothetical protein